MAKRQLIRVTGIFLTVLISTVIGCGKKDNSTDTSGKTEIKTTVKGVEYPADFSFIEVPKPLSGNNPTYPLVKQDVPVCGEQFTDSRFKTIITRVTESPKVRQEYSRFDPFNADQSMILLHLIDSGDWRVYRTNKMPYEKKGNLVAEVRMEELRWDPEDPNIIWATRDFSIITMNMKTGKEKVIKNFKKDEKISPILENEDDINRITMKDEGESSIDKRFWAFALQGEKDDYSLRYIFTWDRDKDQILGLYKLDSEEAELIDWLGMSPNGNWVLIASDVGSGKLAGLNMANKELTEFHRLAPSTGHSDVGLDTEGNEVLVMQNSQTDNIDLIPIDLNTKAMTEDSGKYQEGNPIPIVKLYYNSESSKGFNGGVHISCNFPGYALISTHNEPDVKEQNWLDRSIVIVKLDRKKPRAFYLAKVYNTTVEYWEETHGTISVDGSKVLWASNWNENVGKEKCFVLQLDMPNDWVKMVE